MVERPKSTRSHVIANCLEAAALRRTPILSLCRDATTSRLSLSLHLGGLGTSGKQKEAHFKEASMITKRRCPHTGVVNFYEKGEPLLAVGSVSAGTKPSRYIWRSYLDDQEAGVARKISVAEAHLEDAITRARQHA